MANLVNDINSMICDINSCVANYSSDYIKSETYGRLKKSNFAKNNLTALLHIQDRLERYRDTVLTDACVPNLCSFDPCLQFSEICEKYVKSDNVLLPFERFKQSHYNPARGTTVSMVVVDDDFLNPLNFKRIRFFEWDNCNDTVDIISGYIDVPNASFRNFIYSEVKEKYYVIGSSWIVVLDKDFNLLSTNSYGGSRNWEGVDWNDSRSELYLPDSANRNFEVVDMDTYSILSTTVLPQGATPAKSPAQCMYLDGQVLISGYEKFWSFDVDLVTASLVVDETSNNIQRGAFFRYPDGTVGCLKVDRNNGKYYIDNWKISGVLAYIDNTFDLDVQEPLEVGGQASLNKSLDCDGCGNIYFASMSKLKNSNGDEFVFAVFNKKYVFQDSYKNAIFGTFPEQVGYGMLYNPSSSKYMFPMAQSLDTMTILTIKKRNGNKVAVYPQKCSPYTQADICNLISRAKRLCKEICK